MVNHGNIVVLIMGNIVVLFMGNIVEIQHSVEPIGIEWLIMGI